jgi:hypothetical protein
MTHKDAARVPPAPDGPSASDVSHVPPTVLVAAAVVIEEGRVLVTQRKAGTHLEVFGSSRVARCYPAKTHALRFRASSWRR